MVKKLTFLSLLLTLATTLYAQVSWGAKGGATVSTLGTSSSYQPRLAYHAGFYYAQHLEDQYGIQAELIYSMQGARVNNGTNGRLNYHYISLPIVLKLYFAGTTFAEVGTQPAYLMGATYREVGFKQDRTDVLRRWDVLGLVGFGHETESGTNWGLRFGIGLFNTSGASVGNSVVFRNLILQAHAGIRINDIE